MFFLEGYSDNGYAGHFIEGKCKSGVIFYLGGSAVMWSS